MAEESPEGAPTPRPNFRPSEFMRGRRPYLFSDSAHSLESTVTRETLSFHLETLTSQKSEAVFEEFALRLCEKFVSPNLRPQTGPVGGGDGKTDTETYPVAAAIAARWFVPDSAGAHERWAFAFSAMKDWRKKIRKDVASVVSTKRGYPKIYFVTNQFVPSKDSASMQDALFEKHGVPVVILDRTWLLNRVFEGGSLDIATSVLGVGEGTESLAKKTGPRDFERAAKLDQLETAIGDGSKYQGTPHALAEDCLDAALLARGLEKPRVDVDGRFARAVRVAKDHSLPKQELLATYDWAWTSYFWFEDPAALNRLYDDVERLVADSEDAEEWEKLANLLPFIRQSVRTGSLKRNVAKLDQRTASIVGAFERISLNTARANNALHARAMLLLVRVSERVTADPRDTLVDVWLDYEKVLKDAEGLGTFPFGSFAEALSAIGEFVPESPEFDRLYETMTDALVVRRSEGEAAISNNKRAYQKLTKGLHFDAIRWFGRSVTLLIKEEYEDELVGALIGSSFAFEQAGLLWAARNYALAATNQQFSKFRRGGSIEDVNPRVLSRLFRLELRLGRVPQILSAHALEMIVRKAQARTDDARRELEPISINCAGMLGALILRTPSSQLPQLTRLPDALERAGLPTARVALLMLMGQEAKLREEGWIPASESGAAAAEFFDGLYAQGDKIELPDLPDYFLGDSVTLKSIILGCSLTIVCDNNLASLGVAEAVIGALEALLATSLAHRMLPGLDRFQIRVRQKLEDGVVPSLSFIEEGGETIALISHPPRTEQKTSEDVQAFPNWLQKAVVEIMLKFVMPADFKKWAATHIDEENAFGRAITFSNVPIMIANLYGDKQRLDVADWIEADDVAYPVDPERAWVAKPADADDAARPVQFGDGPPPPGFFEVEARKHTDYKIVSPIDVDKWNAAKWSAVLYIVAPTHLKYPPVLGLAYRNREPAISIFEGFKKRYDVHDPKNELRIAIIRGISASEPLAYGVIVGPNIDNFPNGSGDIFGLVSRIHRMYPESHQNLDRFINEFNRQGRFLLTPAYMSTSTSEAEPLMSYGIGKYHLTVREAWQIGENDPDACVLDLDDLPLIPENQPDAPVLKAIAALTKFRKESA
jgi:hypothetical protein